MKLLRLVINLGSDCIIFLFSRCLFIIIGIASFKRENMPVAKNESISKAIKPWDFLHADGYCHKNFGNQFDTT